MIKPGKPETKAAEIGHHIPEFEKSQKTSSWSAKAPLTNALKITVSFKVPVVFNSNKSSLPPESLTMTISHLTFPWSDISLHPAWQMNPKDFFELFSSLQPENSDPKRNIMSDDIIEKTEKLLQSIGIPSQPRVIMEIEKEMEADDPDFNAISALISQDVAMSAKILKVCNSPFFGLRHKADTVHKALSVLGMKNFRNVIFASALKDTMNSRHIREKDFEYFCNHSLLVAKVAQAITHRLTKDIKSQVDPNHAYMAGLFHDSAIPLLTKKFKDYFHQVIEGLKSNESMLSVEEALFQSNHCIAGYYVAKSWHLPESICISIQNHHSQDIRSVEDLSARRLLAVLILTESIIYHKDASMSDVFEIFNQEVAEGNLDHILFELDFFHDGLADLEDSVQEILKTISEF